MAIKQEICDSVLAADNQTFQASADTAITTIHLCNITSTNAVVDIYLLPHDGSTLVPTESNKLYNTLTIQATDTYIIDTEKLILGNGDKLYIVTPDSSASVVATVSTIGL